MGQTPQPSNSYQSPKVKLQLPFSALFEPHQHLISLSGGLVPGQKYVMSVSEISGPPKPPRQAVITNIHQLRKAEVVSSSGRVCCVTSRLSRCSCTDCF